MLDARHPRFCAKDCSDQPPKWKQPERAQLEASVPVLVLALAPEWPAAQGQLAQAQVVQFHEQAQVRQPVSHAREIQQPEWEREHVVVEGKGELMNEYSVSVLLPWALQRVCLWAQQLLRREQRRRVER